jgi:hypothetical protein
MSAVLESVSTILGRLASAWTAGRGRLAARLADERGEGVISAAIAVLIMAFLGALMWIGFEAMWQTTEDKTNDKIAEIGE